MHVTVALLAIVRGVWACAEPTLMAQSLYDSSSGAALYNGGFACAYSGAPASAGEYMCLLSPNGNTLDLIGASQPSHAPPFQCCANDPVSNLALCLGGLTTDSRLFRFNLTSRLWLDAIDIPPVLALRSGHSCTVSKGNLFVVGGLSSKGDVASPTMFSISLEAYAVRTDYSAPPSAARVGHVTVTLPSDDILVLFGSTSPPPVAQLPTLIFSLENGSWSEYSSKSANSPDLLPQTLDGASCTAWSSTENSDGGVFCYGGRDVAASNPIPYLTYLNLSSATWSNLGSPPTSSGQYSGTFGSSVSLLNGGSVVVVKSGGSALSTNIYTSANVAKNFACSSGDANDGFGNFYGVPPLGPGTCGIEGKPQCPSASSLGATNVPAVGSGWITPAPGVGFPVVTPIMKTAVATAVPSKTNINIKTSSVVSNQGDKDVNGSDGSGLSGARLGLAIGIPVLILLLCCVGGFFYGKNKASRADMKKRSEVPARAPLPGNSVDIGMAALPPSNTGKLDRSVEGQEPTYVAPPTPDTYSSILDQNQSPGDITNSHSGETFPKSAVLGASGFGAMASITKQKFAGVQKNDRSINLIDDSQSSAAIQSESVASETLVGASVATAISMQNEKHAPSAEMGAATLFAVGAGEEVSFESDAGDLVHVPLGGKSAIDDVQPPVGITSPVSNEALYSSRPTEVENVFTAPVVALVAAGAGASAIAHTRRKSDAATSGPAISETSVKPLSKPENHEARGSTLSFFGSFFSSSTNQPSTSESLSRDAVVAFSESALTPAPIAMPSTLEETSTRIDQNGLNAAEEVFLPPLVSSFPLEAAVNEDSRRESDAVLDSAEGNPTYFTPVPEPVASSADVENPNMISVHESTPRELPSVSESSAGEKILMSPIVALSASSVRALASTTESSNRKDVDEIVTLPQSTQGASASTSKRSFFGSFFKSGTNDESVPPSNQLSKDVSVVPGVSDSMTVKPATNEQPSPVAVTGTTYLSDVGVEGTSTDLENVGKGVVSPELSARVPLASSLKQGTASFETTNAIDFNRVGSNVTVVEETMNAPATAAPLTGNNVPVAISQTERAIPSYTNLQQVGQDRLQPEMVELRAVAPSESDAPIIDVAAALSSSNDFGPPVEVSVVEVVPASDLETESEKPGISSNKGVSKMATVVPVLLDSQKPSKKPVFKLFKSKKAVSPASTEPTAADATIVPAALPEHSSELRSSKLTAGPAKMSILDDEIPAISSSLTAAFIDKNGINSVDSWQSKSDETNAIATVGGVALNESGYEVKQTDQNEHDVPKEAEEKLKRLVVGDSEGGKDYQTSFAGSKAIHLAAPEDKFSKMFPAVASSELETATAASSKILDTNLSQFSEEKRSDESLPDPAVDTSATAPVSSQNRDVSGELVSIGTRPTTNSDGPQENAISNSGNLMATSMSTDSKKAPKKPVFKLFKSKKAVLPAETVESNERTLDGIASIAASPAAFSDKNDIKSVNSWQSKTDETNAIATVSGVALNESGYDVKQNDQDEHGVAEKAEGTSRRVVVGQDGCGKEDYQIGPKAIKLDAPGAKFSETSPAVITSELAATTAASSEVLEENLPQLAEEKQSDESLPGPAVGRSDSASVLSQNRDHFGELVAIGTRPTTNSDGPQENAISNSGNLIATSMSTDSKKPPKKALFKMFKSKKADTPTSAGKLNSDVDSKAVVALPLNGRSQDGPQLLAVIEEPTNGIPLDHEIVAISAEVRGADTGDAETDSSVVVDRATTIDDALLSGAIHLSTAKENTGVKSTDTKAAGVTASGTSAEKVGDPQMMPVELSKVGEMATPAHSTIPVVDFAASLNVASVPITSSEFNNSEIVHHEPASRVTVIEEDVISTTLNHADTSIIQQAGITTTKVSRSESSNADTHTPKKGMLAKATAEDIHSSQMASAPSTSAITSRDSSDWTLASPEIPSSAKIPALSEVVKIDAVDKEVNAVVTKESELLIPVESTHLIDNLGVETTSSTELSSPESSDSYIHLSSRVTVFAEAINTAKDISLPQGMPNVPHVESLSVADGASPDLSRVEKLPVTKVDNEPRSPVDSLDFAVTESVKPSITEKSVTVESSLENGSTLGKSMQLSSVTPEPRDVESARSAIPPENDTTEFSEQDLVNVAGVVEGKTQSNSPVASKPRSFFGRILSGVSGSTSSDALNGPLETVAIASAGISPVQEQSPSENKISAAYEDNVGTIDKIDSNARSSTVVVMEEGNEGVLHLNDAAGSVMASNIVKDVAVASSDIQSASVTRSVKAAMSEKVEVSQEVDNLAQNTSSSANVALVTKDETVMRSLEEVHPKTAPLDVATAPDTVSLDKSRGENASFASDGQKSSDAEIHTSVMLATNRELPKTATDTAFAMQGAVPESKPAKKPIVKLVKVSKSEPKKSLVQVLPETDIGRSTDPSSSMTGSESLLDDKKQESDLIVSNADEELANIQVVPQNTADSSSTPAATETQIKIAKKPIVKMVKATRVDRKEETGEHSSIATSDALLPDYVQKDSPAVPAQVPKGSILASSKSDDVFPSTIIDVAASERKVSMLEGVVPVIPDVSHESAPVAPKKVARKIVIAKRKVDTPVISPQLRAAELESSPSQHFSVENTTASNVSALIDKANDVPEETVKFSDGLTTAVGAASPDGVSEASVSVLIPEAGSTGPLAQKELDALTVTSPISKSDGPQIPVPFEFIAVPAHTTRVRSDSVGPQSIDGFDSEIDDRSDAGSAAAESNADSDVTNDGVYFSPHRNTSVSLASELVLGGKRSSIIVRATPTTDLVRSPSRTSLQRPRNSFVYEMTRPGSRTASSSDIRKEARHRLSTVSTPSRRTSAAISIAPTPGVDSVPFGKNAEPTAIDSEDAIVLQKRASMSSLSGRSVDSTGKRKSFLESLNDVSSIMSSVSPRRVTSPTDTISAMKLVDTYGSTVSQGWWTRFTEATKALFSGFDGYEFLVRNSEIDGDRSDDVIMAVFATSGAPVDETEMARCMDQLNASPDLAREFLGELGSVVQTTSPRHFYYNILPIWNANDLAPAMTLKDGLAKMAEMYPEFKPDLFGFIAEAKKISPPFSVSKFLEAYSTVQGDMSEEKIVTCFKYSGADATAEDCKKLLALFSGLWSYDGLRDFSQIVRRVGVPTFLSGYRGVSKPTVEQSRHSAMAWISSISDMGPKVRFDPLSFQNGCRAINPVFTMNTFLVNLADEEEFLGDVTIRKTLSMSGLDLTDEEFEEVMVLSCGDFESRFDVFCGWWQFIRLWGVDSYFASVEGILVEQRNKNALVMTFLSRIHGLGEDVQFNLRGFVASCKKQNADFNLQQFCENVRSIPRLESDSLHEAFMQSGIDLDPDSVEYKNLLETLFGDEALAMAAMREWHYILKRLGSEWSVLYMYALVEQHERVQNSVQDFKYEIQAIPVMIDGKPSQVRFTLRSFVEKCKSLKSEWNSDVAADFDLKRLLEKLTHISDHGNTVDTLISAFKSVGIYTTDKEYELLIGSIAGGDYLSSLVVFQMLIVFLKKWGMEWNMWIIWSLLDDKEHDDDVLTHFVLHVHTFDPKAKFDLVKFVERCGTLENSWQTESSFDLEKFMTGLLAIEGKISLEAVEPVFRSCGIRTTLDEYSDLITTLTGGDFDDIAASVLGYWISLVKLWGVQWFMRCGPSFFERFNNAQAAADKLDTALTITDNRLDVRTFEWYCQIKNGGFSLPNFLDSLVQSAGKNSSNGNDFMTEDMLLLLLSEQGVELSNEELTNLVGVLTGADGNDGMHIIWEWVLLLRAISVRYFMLAYQVESMWASVNVDTGLAIKAFHSRASYRCERFSVERFLTTVQDLKEDWDVEQFFNYLVEIHGDVSLLHFQQAFKATDVDVTSDQAMDLLTTLTGDEVHALSVAQDWISTAWVVGIRTLLEAENAIQVEKVPEESGGWFFSRVIQAAESAARAVSGRNLAKLVLGCTVSAMATAALLMWYQRWQDEHDEEVDDNPAPQALQEWYQPDTRTVAQIDGLPLSQRLKDSHDWVSFSFRPRLVSTDHDHAVSEPKEKASLQPYGKGLGIIRNSSEEDVARFEAHLIRGNALYGPGRIEYSTIAFNPDRRAIVKVVRFGSKLTGHEGVLHGGCTAGFFDDAFGTLFFLEARGEFDGVTANLSINYRAPILTPAIVAFVLWIDRIEGRKVFMKGEVRSVANDADDLSLEGAAEGDVDVGASIVGGKSIKHAEATCLFIKLNHEQMAKMKQHRARRLSSMPQSNNNKGLKGNGTMLATGLVLSGGAAAYLLSGDSARPLSTKAAPVSVGGSGLTPAEAESVLRHYQKSILTDLPRHSVVRCDLSSVASNDPREDFHSEHQCGKGLLFAVMDGHGGTECADVVQKHLAAYVANALDVALGGDTAKRSSWIPSFATSVSPISSTSAPSISSDPRILSNISMQSTNDQSDGPDPVRKQLIMDALVSAFARLDDDICNGGIDIETPVSTTDEMIRAHLRPALAGSCTLLAYIEGRDLYVACTGDSRAVLGRRSTIDSVWLDPLDLSVDQTVRNPQEYNRLLDEHPGELETVVVKGRVLGGLMPTRAFGDARYKWPTQLSSILLPHVTNRNPPKNYKTPPYVTARPVVTHYRITPSRDMFLVLATDGLYDELSSQEVVTVVSGFLQHHQVAAKPTVEWGTDPLSNKSFKLTSDTNAATCLIRNALGGANEDKMRKLMGIPAPYSRRFRDDITVNVLFFQHDSEVSRHVGLDGARLVKEATDVVHGLPGVDLSLANVKQHRLQSWVSYFAKKDQQQSKL
ncbi:hypothetical protein CcCBS67573_g01318 [Chytriomyces confervae]|uniref:PPM-type phosphatase domain-containing protein n=1 Tax=Chytriomyces confervae TaxID=246404 RepID=A0A507FPC3_9FUNG|nr:hypothetical protein CcCBS67573_g01318 [Chytriomyces confervae]